MLFFLLAFITVAGFCEGVMDTLQFHFYQSTFAQSPHHVFWNPTESWRNKYRDGDPSKGPRFFLSTTWLVSLTDGWHLFKLLRNIFLFLALPAAGALTPLGWHTLLIAAAGRAMYGIGFSIAYYKVLRKP